MSRRNKSHGHQKETRQHADTAPVSPPDRDESPDQTQPDSLKTKSFDEIIKGFKEIEKIEHTASAQAAQAGNDESADSKKSGAPKSKSYAEIIRGFQEIEKIISNSQSSE
jgi:hypothetical protein